MAIEYQQSDNGHHQANDMHVSHQTDMEIYGYYNQLNLGHEGHQPHTQLIGNLMQANLVPNEYNVILEKFMKKKQAEERELAQFYRQCTSQLNKEQEMREVRETQWRVETQQSNCYTQRVFSDLTQAEFSVADLRKDTHAMLKETASMGVDMAKLRNQLEKARRDNMAMDERLAARGKSQMHYNPVHRYTGDFK